MRGVKALKIKKFVEDYAEKQPIPLFLTQFDTTAFAKD
jgi:tRNA(Ile)-lysidine synthase